MVSARENSLVGFDESFTWRQAQAFDCAVLLDWRNDPVSVLHSKSRAPISEKDHSRWFVDALRNDNTVLLIAETNGLPIATTRFDRSPSDSLVYLVSITVAPSHRRKGMGKQLLSSAISNFFSSRNADLVADVHQYNLASQKIFTSAGFLEEKADSEFKQFRYSADTRNEND